MPGIEHNFDLFVRALARAPERYKKEVQEPLAEFIGFKFGEFATEKYMQEGPTSFDGSYPPRPENLGGPIRKLSGRLANAVRGKQDEQISLSHTEIKTTIEGILWKREIFVLYAKIHETGGTITVPTTQGMVAHFWKRWYETGQREDSAFKAMALAAQSKSKFVINIPKRPYVRPALRDIHPFVVEEGNRLLNNFLKDILRQ